MSANNDDLHIVKNNNHEPLLTPVWLFSISSGRRFLLHRRREYDVPSPLLFLLLLLFLFCRKRKCGVLRKACFSVTFPKTLLAVNTHMKNGEQS